MSWPANLVYFRGHHSPTTYEGIHRFATFVEGGTGAYRHTDAGHAAPCGPKHFRCRAARRLTYDGQKFPFPEDQFTKTQPDHCEQVHYHGGIGFSMEFKKVREPDGPCGFGSDVKDEQADTEAIIRWMQEGPKAVRL